MKSGTVQEIVMPQLAESVVNATIERWLKQPGDSVGMYEPLCEIITEKVGAEIPSTIKGTLVKLLVGAGETVNVGTPICLIEVEADQAATSAPAAAQAASATSVGAEQSSGEATNRAGLSASAARPELGDVSMRGRYSPAVLQLSAQHNINPADVPGTGAGGRVTRKDILAFVAGGDKATQSQATGREASVAAASATSAQSAMQPGDCIVEPQGPVRSTGLHLTEPPRIPKVEVEAQQVPGRGEYFIDVTPVRNTIASRMRQSVNEIPHGWMMIEVDVTNLVVLRSKLKDEFMKREGTNLTYLSFFIKAVVNAIKDFPIINSVWAVDKIIVKRDINISLSVGTEDSVVTPVIRNADQKNIAGLAHEIETLARKTREGKLRLDDVQGGTFTVNNTGSFGAILTQPIINYPQAAIITFESIVKRPVVINDMLAVRSMANICLSLDHRILDGVICGRFLQRVKENLEGFNSETQLY
ncbi:dihydrolipoamide acetyltransferase family protein [Paenibacillus herberti]|uniref:Dihydrolipoamide acetyltransferase component of pyruvate dehydrogenase complex n=1 Tax=Paenibacillus herberti TaxID=1619309 RepID=A0A229P3U2_9BACL|nr:dihydrolipoamide acetyltransferase family protein [Paenibacillus herberti]OXM16721.1 branched-chain alpha-keto acid dehydrogenase subunit E2 [Paenibacillus herberti]